MKTIRYIAFATLLTAAAACTNNNRDKATLGSTQDTTAVAGNGSNGTSADSTNKDSMNNGNANPTGHVSGDTVSKKPAQ